jgi:hypothetical protein
MVSLTLVSICKWMRSSNLLPKIRQYVILHEIFSPNIGAYSRILDVKGRTR